MGKEAQIKEIASIVRAHHIGCNLPKECNTECDICTSEAIYDVGYRKLLKDKPPLLGDEEINAVGYDWLAEYKEELYEYLQAQRESDIKHYEGAVL